METLQGVRIGVGVEQDGWCSMAGKEKDDLLSTACIGGRDRLLTPKDSTVQYSTENYTIVNLTKHFLLLSFY